MKFHEAIKFMTENPGKEVKGPEGDLLRFESGHYWFLDGGEKSWEQVGCFGSEDIEGQWTIPEPELPEVEVVMYVDNSGQVYFAKQGSHDSNYFQKDDRYTKCKIKFNQ